MIRPVTGAGVSGGDLYAEFGERIMSLYGGMELEEVDRELDATRRYVWTRHFSGLDARALNADMRPSPLVKATVEALGNRPIHELAVIIERLRLAFWQICYQADGPTGAAVRGHTGGNVRRQ